MMRFALYAALVATAAACPLKAPEAEFAQFDGELAELDAQPHANADGIIADAKWLGGKALGAAKAVGGAIDSAYDATKAGIKKGAKAIANAPGNAVARVKKFKKDHNFAQGQRN